MKTMALVGLRRMEMREAPRPRLRAETDVLLKVETVGVCGSDIHYYTEGRIGAQVVEYPFAVGHECAATVVEVGPAVRRVRPGARVAVEPAVSCDVCDQCLGGRPHTCRRIRFLGCPGQAEGCLTEYLVMPEACCLPLAAQTTFEQAALIEPLAIGLYAARRAGALKGAQIGILGSGPIGLCVLTCARLMGVQAAYVTDKIPERLAVARAVGAAWTGHPETDDPPAAVAQREPLLLDVVFECCGEQAAVDQAVEMLKPGGTLMLVGIPSVERIAFTIDRARRKELVLRNVRRQCHCAEDALRIMEAGLLPVDFLVTHRFGFAQTREAFDLVAGYRDGVVKAMIAMGGMP